MTDRSDAVVVTWKPKGEQTRRYTFEPQSDGGWVREEETLRLDGWSFVGSEPVESLSVEGADNVE